MRNQPYYQGSSSQYSPYGAPYGDYRHGHDDRFIGGLGLLPFVGGLALGTLFNNGGCNGGGCGCGGRYCDNGYYPPYPPYPPPYQPYPPYQQPYYQQPAPYPYPYPQNYGAQAYGQTTIVNENQFFPK